MPRVSDVYAALPSLTGKFELEYEGELMGADNVARELIRASVGEAFSVYLGSADLKPVVAFFEAGGNLKLRDDASRRGRGRAAQARARASSTTCTSSASTRATPRRSLASAAEFVLEGLYAPEEDRAQRRPRLRGPRAPRGDATPTSSAWSACAG